MWKCGMCTHFIFYFLQLSINMYKYPIDAYFFTSPGTSPDIGFFYWMLVSSKPAHSKKLAHCLLLAPLRRDLKVALAKSVLLCPPYSVPNLSLGLSQSFALGASN